MLSLGGVWINSEHHINAYNFYGFEVLIFAMLCYAFRTGISEEVWTSENMPVSPDPNVSFF